MHPHACTCRLHIEMCHNKGTAGSAIVFQPFGIPPCATSIDKIALGRGNFEISTPRAGCK